MIPEWIQVLTYFLSGSLVGSHLNVVILRIPKGEEIVKTPSHCPKCNHSLSPLDLVPILAYLFTLGKCRYCRAPISFQYPVIESITAIFFSFFLIKEVGILKITHLIGSILFLIWGLMTARGYLPPASTFLLALIFPLLIKFEGGFFPPGPEQYGILFYGIGFSITQLLIVYFWSPRMTGLFLSSSLIGFAHFKSDLFLKLEAGAFSWTLLLFLFSLFNPNKKSYNNPDSDSEKGRNLDPYLKNPFFLRTTLLFIFILTS